MATATDKAPTQLRVTRTFAAPREKVFRAWTDPQALKTWFAPSDKFATRIPELDLRVGGRYRIEMQLEDKNNIVVGTYRFCPSWAGSAGLATRIRGPPRAGTASATVRGLSCGSGTAA